MIWPKMILGTFALGAALAFAQTQATTAPQNPNPQGQPQNHSAHGTARHGDWLKKFKDLPPDQQKAALENDPTFKKLPPERQEKLRQQLAQFNNMPTEQSEKIVKRMMRFKNIKQEQKQQTRKLAQRYHNVSPEQR